MQGWREQKEPLVCGGRRRRSSVHDSRGVGVVGSDDGVDDAADAFAVLYLELLVDVEIEEVGKEIVDDGVNDTIEEERELRGGIGYALSHRRREKVTIDDLKAAEKISGLGAWRFAFAEWDEV